MLSLKTRLLSAEQECLSAMLEGGDAVVAFSQRWEDLVAEADRACDSDELDPETMSLVYITATRVATLVDTTVELLSTCDGLTSLFVEEMESLLSQLTLEDMSSEQSRPSRSRRPSPSRSSVSSLDSSEHNSSRGGRKRRRSSESSEDACRSPQDSYKRKRVVVEHSPSPSSTSLSSSDILTPSLPVGIDIPRPLASISTSVKRKRCFSETDGEFPHAKRHHVGPRLHAVSDSYPSLRVTEPILKSCDPHTTLLSMPSAPYQLSQDFWCESQEGNAAEANNVDIFDLGMGLHMISHEEALPPVYDCTVDPTPSLSELADLDEFLQSLFYADSQQDAGSSPGPLSHLPEVDICPPSSFPKHTAPSVDYLSCDSSSDSSSSSSSPSFPSTPTSDQDLEFPSPDFRVGFCLPLGEVSVASPSSARSEDAVHDLSFGGSELAELCSGWELAPLLPSADESASWSLGWESLPVFPAKAFHEGQLPLHFGAPDEVSSGGSLSIVDSVVSLLSPHPSEDAGDSRNEVQLGSVVIV